MNSSRVLARLAAVLSAQVFFGITPFTTASALQMPEGTWTDVTNQANSFTVQGTNPAQTAVRNFTNYAGRTASFRSRPPCDRDMYLNGGCPEAAPVIIHSGPSDYLEDEPYLNTREPGSEVGGIPGRDQWSWPTSSSPYSGGGGGGYGGGGGASLPEPPGEGFQPMYQHGQFVGWYTPEQVARSATDFAGVLREVVNGPYYYGGAGGAASILYEIGDIPSPFAYGFGF